MCLVSLAVPDLAAVRRCSLGRPGREPVFDDGEEAVMVQVGRVVGPEVGQRS